jgi:hypothetical protein
MTWHILNELFFSPSTAAGCSLLTFFHFLSFDFYFFVRFFALPFSLLKLKNLPFLQMKHFGPNAQIQGLKLKARPFKYETFFLLTLTG